MRKVIAATIAGILFIATMTVACAQYYYYRDLPPWGGPAPRFNPYIYQGPIGRGYGGWEGPNVRYGWVRPEGWEWREGYRGRIRERQIPGYWPAR